MPDSDVQITAGSGTKIDTRTVGTGSDEHRQVMVIGDPTTAANVAPVDATNGLKVDVANFYAEDSAHVNGDKGVVILGVRNHFGGSTSDGDYAAISVSSNGDLHTVGRRDLVKSANTVTGLTTSSTNYSAGDQLGNLITVPLAARVSGGSGTIVGVVLADQSDVIGAVDVVFFDTTSVTLAGNNNAFSINTTDVLEVVGIAQLGNALDIGATRVAQLYNIAIPYTLSTGTSLGAALMTRSSGFVCSAGVSSLQLTVYMERN